MQVLYYFFIYIFGLIFGSFLNLVSDRVVNGGSIVFGRSKCDSCKKELTSKDLIPVFSFLLAKGKCKYCSTKLSYMYPLSEMLTAFAFLYIAIYSKIIETFSILSFFTFVFLIMVACFYIVLFLTDAKYRLIPNKVVYSGIILVILFIVFRTGFDYLNVKTTLGNDQFGKYMLKAGYAETQLWYEVKDILLTLASSAIISGFFLFLIKITRGRGMGGGDVTLGFLIGLVNGFPHNFLAIFLGFVLGALYSVVLILFGKKSMKDTIPFGPFLILGSVITYFWGAQVLAWYFRLF